MFVKGFDVFGREKKGRKIFGLYFLEGENKGLSWYTQ